MAVFCIPYLFSIALVKRSRKVGNQLNNNFFYGILKTMQPGG